MKKRQLNIIENVNDFMHKSTKSDEIFYPKFCVKNPCARGLPSRDRGIQARDRGFRQPVRGETKALEGLEAEATSLGLVRCLTFALRRKLATLPRVVIERGGNC